MSCDVFGEEIPASSLWISHLIFECPNQRPEPQMYNGNIYCKHFSAAKHDCYKNKTKQSNITLLTFEHICI